MPRSVDPKSQVAPAVRLVASLVVGGVLAFVAGEVLGEYTFLGKGIQWLAMSGGAGLGAAMAWVLNRVWSHDPPPWMMPVAAVLAMAGEALAVQRDVNGGGELIPLSFAESWPPEAWAAVVLAAVASAYGIYSAHRVAGQERAKKP